MPINTISTMINGSICRATQSVPSGNNTLPLINTTLLNADGFTYETNSEGDRLIATSAGSAGQYIAMIHMDIDLGSSSNRFDYDFNMVLKKNGSNVLLAGINLSANRDYQDQTVSSTAPLDVDVAVNDYFTAEIVIVSDEVVTVNSAKFGLFKLS